MLAEQLEQSFGGGGLQLGGKCIAVVGAFARLPDVLQGCLVQELGHGLVGQVE